MNASQDSLSRRLGHVFAELAAQAANAQQGPKSGQQGVENPNPMPAPSKAHKPALGGYPGMTIYTDKVTGKKYDRVPGGVATGTGYIQGYKPCSECAFCDAVKHGEECSRAAEYCISRAGGKNVFFVFKERKRAA